MRIAIVTDAWQPQVNGVVTTLSTTATTLEKLGHQVLVVNPQQMRTLPCPTYPEIRLAWRPYRKVAEQLCDYQADRLHIATEGPLGLAARRYALREGLRFTTSYHTQFPQYVRARAPIPMSASILRVALVKAPLGPLLSASWNLIACSLFLASLAISISNFWERASVIAPNTPLRILPMAADPPPVKKSVSNSNIGDCMLI